MKLTKLLSLILVLMVLAPTMIPVLKVESTLNRTWVVPTDSVTVADVDNSRGRVAAWLFKSLFFANSSSDLAVRGRWLPFTFFLNTTSSWTGADRENGGFFYDFYVTSAFLETGNRTYARWLKGWADNFMKEKQTAPHYEAAVLMGLMNAYDYYYNRNNATFRDAIDSRVRSLITTYQNPNTGLWGTGVKDDQGMKKSYVIRAVARWYEITRDPTFLDKISLTVNFWLAHQVVYGGQYWWHRYNWTTGQVITSDVPSTGMYANFHDIQQGLDGVAYAAMVTGRGDFKPAFKKYLDWWVNKGIDSEGRIWNIYTFDQKPSQIGSQGGGNGYIGALLSHLSLGYLWLGDPAYLEAARKVFHTMTKWMTFSTSQNNYSFGYAFLYDPATDNPTGTVGSTYGPNSVSGFATNYAYAGLTNFIKALTKNIEWRRGTPHIFNIADNKNGNFTERREGPYSITIDNQYVNGTYTFSDNRLTIRTWANASLSAVLYVNATHNGAPTDVSIDGQPQNIQFSSSNSTIRIQVNYQGANRVITVDWGPPTPRLSVSLAKTPDRSFAHVGENVSYTIVVVNDGEASANLTLTDPDLAVPASFNLLTGESASFATWHIVVPADQDPLRSTATVSATDALNRTVVKSAEAVVDTLHPRIIMRLTVSPSDDLTQVTYTIVVRNPSGDTPLSNITVSSFTFGVIRTGLSQASSSETQLAPFTRPLNQPFSDTLIVQGQDVTGVSVTFQISISI